MIQPYSRVQIRDDAVLLHPSYRGLTGCVEEGSLVLSTAGFTQPVRLDCTNERVYCTPDELVVTSC